VSRYLDALRNAQSAFWATLAGRYEDRTRNIKGDVSIELRNAFTGALELAWQRHNVVTMDASILIARLVKDSLEAPHGAFVLAVGSGDIGWNPLSPPAATNTQRALFAEITRKTFASSQFIDGDGVPVGYPTNVVDFTTVFAESEAVGPLVEMGIIGGNISSNMSIKNPVTPPNGPYDATVDLTTAETLCNYLTYGVIVKPATSTFTVTWRLSF
jgi:hypothetical protein